MCRFFHVRTPRLNILREADLEEEEEHKKEEEEEEEEGEEKSERQQWREGSGDWRVRERGREEKLALFGGYQCCSVTPLPQGWGGWGLSREGGRRSKEDGGKADARRGKPWKEKTLVTGKKLETQDIRI
ncbi:hypothetical protein E2C01_017455 [Portunus trituberculatus]|uniref:Uncharacterized protein n=1 Tax=Portunus trituberculatus TaxID=210409 RepID=A0A5B7DTH6_PORTR|nr:hypothetical protein [Portunus trituberculatus]